MTTGQDLLNELEALGTEQNRKTYRRHGIGAHTYGVSYANLEVLRKRIKTNQELAEQLWASAVHDARVLATMIADPRQIALPTIEAWAAQLGNHVIADAFAKLVARTAGAAALMEQWVKSGDEQIRRAGWHLLAVLATSDSAMPDGVFEPYVDQIEREIQTDTNRVREAMNNALIAIGSRSEHLETLAIAAAGAIGVVHVDHGDTSCKTPDAAAYIRKTRARQQSRLAKAR